MLVLVLCCAVLALLRIKESIFCSFVLSVALEFHIALECVVGFEISRGPRRRGKTRRRNRRRGRGESGVELSGGRGRRERERERREKGVDLARAVVGDDSVVMCEPLSCLVFFRSIEESGSGKITITTTTLSWGVKLGGNSGREQASQA